MWCLVETEPSRVPLWGSAHICLLVVVTLACAWDQRRVECGCIVCRVLLCVEGKRAIGLGPWLLVGSSGVVVKITKPRSPKGLGTCFVGCFSGRVGI